jgi:hypothetical protein
VFGPLSISYPLPYAETREYLARVVGYRLQFLSYGN